MHKLLVFILLLSSGYISAQELRTQQDFGVWVGFAFKKELPKKFGISLEQQLRTCVNSTKIDNYWSQLGASYTINKNFRLSGGFRYIYNIKKGGDAENNLRYNFDLEFRTKIKKNYRISYRFRYQQKIINLFHQERTVRNRVKFVFKYKKVHNFYFSTGLFISSKLFRKAYLDKLRFSLGDKIKTGAGRFNLALGYEVNLQPDDSSSFFFLKVIYSIEL